tara:strand:- start:483 stop:929 length:447 start_codon:yes stop_codon:yes gene_type:complete
MKIKLEEHQKYETKYQDLVLFDGTCNLCNWWVDLIIKLDKKKKFKFHFLQNEISNRFLKLVPSDRKNNQFDSIIVIKNISTLLTKSDAAIYVMSRSSKLFFVLRLFLIVPTFIRDGVYNFIGRNRYKWFGKKNVCRVITDDIKNRFVN